MPATAADWLTLASFGCTLAAKHLILDISDSRLDSTRDQAAISAEAALDGIYVIRTPVPAAQMDPAAVTSYKNLSRAERDFRSIKADDLDLRPVRADGRALAGSTSSGFDDAALRSGTPAAHRTAG